MVLVACEVEVPHPYLAKVTRMAWDGRKSEKEEVEERVEEVNRGGTRGDGGIREKKGGGKERRGETRWGEE